MEILKLTGDSFDALGNVKFEDGSVRVPKGSNAIVSKKSFRAPVKVEFSFVQVLLSSTFFMNASGGPIF